MNRAQAERIIRDWQQRLGLERWKIEIDWDESAGEGNNAKTWRSDLYDTARILWDPEWAKWPREKFEQTAIHELLHLLHRDLDETWKDIEGQMHRDAWSLADKRYYQEMEGFIDRLAFRLYEIAGES